MMEANHRPCHKICILNALIICRILRKSNIDIRLIYGEPRRENLIELVAGDKKKDLSSRQTISAPRSAKSLPSQVCACVFFGSARLIRSNTMPSPNVSLTAAAASLISFSVNECHGDNTIGGVRAVSWPLSPQLIKNLH